MERRSLGAPTGDAAPHYVYCAQCPQTGALWQLPRTAAAEAAARKLMAELAVGQPAGQGHLYGVLVVQTATGERHGLKAVSGAVAGHQGPNWVPPLPPQAQIALVEPSVLARLDHLKKQLINLGQRPEQTQYERLSEQYARELRQLAAAHRRRKQSRDRIRSQTTLQGDALTQALNTLKKESQRDSAERHQLKKQRDQALGPLTQKLIQIKQQQQQLKQQYTTLSQQWQKHLKTAYETQWAAEKESLNQAESLALEEIIHNIPSPSGNLGQRAAAKLLHYAVSHHLTPLAMAEFWWGPAHQDFHPGQFYGASPEDCQLLMNLAKPTAHITTAQFIKILYHDQALIVVNKPAGLLSVPGRRYHQQDSVLSRLRHQLGDSAFLQVVHRLDQATSGILVLATSPAGHKSLAQQFAQRRVKKTYEALLSRPVAARLNSLHGTIDLPLWGNPDQRPKQWVNANHGKPSITHFQVLAAGPQPRVEFRPHTGRTHQLRVHAAHPQGLDAPILGDSLYGDAGSRLHLHAKSLQLLHPITQQPLHFTSKAPF